MKIVLTILTFLTLAQATGQNLIPNSSFEDTVHCPTNIGQITNCKYWINPTQCSPDYYNACSTNAHVPNNGNGNQSAKTGLAYAGICTFFKYAGYGREYIQALLTTSLISGHKYFVSFYVSLAEASQYSASSIGAYFSATPITGTNCDILNISPQIQNKSSNVLNNKINWQQISDTLYSNGTEKYITIGNFNSDSLSDTLFLGVSSSWNAAYYFIDDVSVIDFGLITNIGQYNNKGQINIYPNPTSDQSILRFDNTKAELCTLTFYDLRGQIIRTINNITSDQVVIQKNNLTNGMYYFVLRTSDRVIVTGKLAVD